MRVLLLAGLLLLPAAAAVEVGVDNPYGPTPTTLYFHLLDAQNDLPVNTQKPDAAYSVVPRVGVLTNSLCLDEAADPDPPAGQPLADKEYHTLVGYSSRAYVEYAFLTDGKPRIHPERGLGYDVDLDARSQPTLHWYLSTGPGVTASGASADDAVMVVPNVVVEATMRDGVEFTGEEDEHRAGAIIMTGQSSPAVLAGPATSGATYTEVDGRHVYGFRVPLEVRASRISGTAGYTVEVNVYVENPYCATGSEGDYLMPNAVDHYLDAAHLPRLELSILNPLRIQYLAPQFVRDDLVVHASVQSAWGGYDVDEAGAYNGNRSDGLGFQVFGPDGRPVVAGTAETMLYQEWQIVPHDRDVTLAHVWNHTRDGAPGGLYTVHFYALNDQGTANATASAAFEIGRSQVYPAILGEDPYSVQEESLAMPGAGPLAFVVALGLAVVLRRR